MAADQQLSDDTRLRHALRLTTHEELLKAKMANSRAYWAWAEHHYYWRRLDRRLEELMERAEPAMKRAEDARWEAWGYSAFAPWKDGVGVWERSRWVLGVVTKNCVLGDDLEGYF